MADACCGPEEHPDHEESSDTGAEGGRWWQVRELQLAIAAAVLLAIGWLLATLGTDLAGRGLELASAVVGAASFAPGAARGLRRGRVGVGTLMTIAAIGAVALGQFAEAALLGVLFSVAEGLEHHAITRTRRSLRALLALVPRTASVVRGSPENQVETQLAPEDLELGDRLLLRAGERAATDAVLGEGRTSLDVSAITGESVPVEAGPGDTVHAGAINVGSAVELTVIARAVDSSLARIVHIVEQAQDRKGAGQRLADRIARPLVPAILALATAIAGLGVLLGDPLLWIERALVVLVAASPCALAISVPLTVVAAVGAASRHGALVKGGAALEDLGRVRTVALDKTGTLTCNDPRVVDVLTAAGTARGDVLGAAAALEARSEHPLAAAVLTAHREIASPADTPIAPGPATLAITSATVAAPASAPVATDVETVPGHGLLGRINGACVALGKPAWITGAYAAAGGPGPELAADVERLEHDGATVVLLARDDRVIGAIAVRDELRPEAIDAVGELRGLGLEVAMLTGDNPRAATALARRAGIDRVEAGLRPEDKAGLITDLQGAGRRDRGRVAMVGDGVNDAPALATADVGVAMGAMGTDVAIETADVALMGEDLRHLPQLFGHARHARRVMLQNVGFSLAIIVVLIPLAALGALGLAAVVFIHELAEVLVIGNALRGARLQALPDQPAPVAAPTSDRPPALVLAPAGGHPGGDGCCEHS